MQHVSRQAILRKGVGFTLIELMAVVAIISILALIVIYGVSDARKHARLSSAQSMLLSARPVAQACVDDGKEITDPSIGPSLICQGNVDAWQALPAGWTYGVGCTFSTNASTARFTYCASDVGWTVTCDQSNCVTVSI